MNYLAIWTGEGPPPRDLVSQIEYQTQVRLVKSAPNQASHVLTATPDGINAFMGRMKGWKYEPHYPDAQPAAS